MMAMPCPTLDARLERDRARGVETSAAARAFVRRTCRCADCIAWRTRARQAGVWLKGALAGAGLALALLTAGGMP